MNIHEKYIKRCIEIAKNGLGSTRPNPMVGCVIVHNEIIIGEGYTSPFGGDHAEVKAINSVKNKDLLKDSTIYVTLEPCAHFAKTPPCTSLIIESQIPKVYIGCMDDNELVSGRGIAKLKSNGLMVHVGILEKECRHHHRRFFTFHNKKRPYIILKWAQSSDGFIAPLEQNNREPVWISNQYSRQLVHKWRAEEQAILVGYNTVLKDNPSLTVRDWTGQNPIRFALDKDESLSKDSNIFNIDAETFRINGSEVDFTKPLAQQICNFLFEKQINSVIIEGGLKTLQMFIDENLWDEARIFESKIKLVVGKVAPKIKGHLISEERIMSDSLKYFRND